MNDDYRLFRQPPLPRRSVENFELLNSVVVIRGKMLLAPPLSLHRTVQPCRWTVGPGMEVAQAPKELLADPAARNGR